MTKTNKPVTEAIEEPLADDLASVAGFEPAIEMARNHYWARENALDKAIQFHKTNGGMMHPAQLVDHAQIFLTFLNGESK
jgi:hypothetical protein